MKVVCAIYDKSADNFGQPIFVRAVGEGIRIFMDEVNRSAQDNLMYMHPDDFDLYEIGFYDEDTGRFAPADVDSPLNVLARGAQVKNR